MSVPHAVEDVAALDAAYVEDALLLGARLISPWLTWLDPAKGNAHVQRIRTLPIDTVAICHAPAIRGPQIERAFQTFTAAPGLEPWPEFGQDDLDGWMAVAGIEEPA